MIVKMGILELMQMLKNVHIPMATSYFKNNI